MWSSTVHLSTISSRFPLALHFLDGETELETLDFTLSARCVR
jgi:hypothetical protein